MATHLSGESLDEDGNKEVEKDVVAEGHEGNEIEGSPGRGACHAGVEHCVPVFLCQDLKKAEPWIISLLFFVISEN